MADPLSILTGVLGTLDVGLRFAKYLKEINEGAKEIDEDIAELLREITILNSTNSNLKEIWSKDRDLRLEKAKPDPISPVLPGTPLSSSGATMQLTTSVQKLWVDTKTSIEDSGSIILKLENVVKSIYGDSVTSKGTRDRFWRAIKKHGKEQDFRDIRQQLTTSRIELQVSLTSLTFAYQRASDGSHSEELRKGFNEMHQAILSLKERTGEKQGTEEGMQASRIMESAGNLLSSAKLNKHFDIPQKVQSFFTGREKYLTDLKTYFDADLPGTQKRFIIHGLGGSGKTQFCCKFAQVYRDDFWGIFWIDASSEATAEYSYKNICKFGGIEPSEKAARNWLANLEFNYLLLIDNADSDANIVEKYFPEGERGCVIVTTRDPSNKVHGTVGPGSWAFEELDPEEALTLLLTAAGKRGPWDCKTKMIAEKVTAKLGYLALAIVHAGGAIASGSSTLSGYAKALDDSWEKIRRNRIAQSSRRGSAASNDIDNRSMTIYSSFEILHDRLEKMETRESRDALELMNIFAFYNRENISFMMLSRATRNYGLKISQWSDEQESKRRPWSEILTDVAIMLAEYFFGHANREVLPSVFRHLDNEGSYNETLAEDRLRAPLKLLTKRSLISWNEETDTFSIHPLTQTWVRERHTISEQAVWCEAAMIILSRSVKVPPLGGTTIVDDVFHRDQLPHLLTVTEFRKSIHDALSTNRKRFQRSWMPIIDSPFNRIQAVVDGKFSLIYVQSGEWSKAEKLQTRIRDFVIAHRGEDHPIAIKISVALSITYMLQSRWIDANILLRQILKSCEKSLGHSHRLTLQVMDKLSSSCCLLGSYKEALELSEKAERGMEKRLGPNDHDTLLAKFNRGRVMEHMLRFQDAADIFENGINMLTQKLPEDHYDVLEAKEDYAMILLEIRGKKNVEAALSLVKNIIDEHIKHFGEGFSLTQRAKAYYARAKFVLGDYEDAEKNQQEAEKIMREALATAERSVDSNHYSVVTSKVYLAQFLIRQGRLEDGEEILIKTAHDTKNRNGGIDGNETQERIYCLYWLLRCYQKQGKIDDALRVYQELSVAKTFGGDLMSQSWNPFVEILEERGRELEAAKAGLPIGDSPYTRQFSTRFL